MSKHEKQRSRKHVGILAVAACVLGLGVSVTDAGVIPDRATLDGILGGGGLFEDFETYVVDGLADNWAPFVLDENTVLDGQGPGLVQDGAVYSAGMGPVERGRPQRHRHADDPCQRAVRAPHDYL